MTDPELVSVTELDRATVAGATARLRPCCASNEAGPNQPGTRRGVAAYALDPEAAARLWQVSVDTLAG